MYEYFPEGYSIGTGNRPNLSLKPILETEEADIARKLQDARMIFHPFQDRSGGAGD
jgi:hypothetical protein